MALTRFGRGRPLIPWTKWLNERRHVCWPQIRKSTIPPHYTRYSIEFFQSDPWKCQYFCSFVLKYDECILYIRCRSKPLLAAGTTPVLALPGQMPAADKARPA